MIENISMEFYQKVQVRQQLRKKQNDSLKEEKENVKQLKNLTAMKEVSKQEAVEEKKGEIKKIEKTNRKKMMMMKKNIKKNCLIMCMDLINSDDNIDELFGISVFNNGVIRFRIYTDFKKKII